MPNTPLKSPLSQKRPFDFQKQMSGGGRRAVKKHFDKTRTTKNKTDIQKNIANIQTQTRSRTDGLPKPLVKK
jgi:hypothetical protein